MSKLNDVTFNDEADGIKNSYWQPTIIFGESWDMTLEKRNLLIDKLNKKNVALRPLFYPVSQFPMYEDVKTNKVSNSIYHRGINLPSYFELERGDIEYVCKELLMEIEKK